MNGAGRVRWVSAASLLVAVQLAGAATLRDALRAAPCRVIGMDGAAVTNAAVTVERTWDGDVCHTRVRNAGTASVPVMEVVLFDVALDLPPGSALWGEGNSMLSQTAGTLESPVEMGDSDARVFKLRQPAGSRAMYGVITLSPARDDHRLLGFASCRRFLGKFYLYPKERRLEVVQDARIPLDPGESWELEDFALHEGADREALLAAFAAQVQARHPMLRIGDVATGWCSWYCFGAGASPGQVRRNLQFIRRELPALRYIQIDDGYQPEMGDWLEPGRAFGGQLPAVLRDIRAEGCEPAIWVAPFVAGAKSKLFAAHPDWVARGADGQAVLSGRVYRDAWRLGPWYILDGTHPGAQKFLEDTFRTMRREWGCTYFKLDANSWGACPNVRFHDPKATPVEAFRRGMEAVLRGAGPDSFILGCNSPQWPSLGLIHGNRASFDILGMDWVNYAQTARLTFARNWQNGRLWWNDPDCVRIGRRDLPENLMMFHLTALYASGGMILASDDLPALPTGRVALVKALAARPGVAARFEDGRMTEPVPGQQRWGAQYGFADRSMEVGWIEAAGRTQVALFNWQPEPRTIAFERKGRHRLVDVWTGAAVGAFTDRFETNLPAQSARLWEVAGE